MATLPIIRRVMIGGYCVTCGAAVARQAQRGSRPTLAQLEAELAKHRLCFTMRRDPAAERAYLPSMTEVFEDLCSANRGVPPSPQDFVDEFARRYSRDHPELFGALWAGVHARLLRSHPSFVRERHLQAMLSESGVICARSASADQKHGIDLVVVYGKFAVRISTFMGTERGRNWRREKLKRADCDGYFIELPLSEPFVRTVGEYKLYGPWHVEAIRSTLPSMVRTPSARWTVVPKQQHVGWTAVDSAVLEDLPF